MSSFQCNRAWLASVLSGGLLFAGAAQAAVTIDSLSINVGGNTSAIEAADVRDEDESPEEVTQVAPSIFREVTVTSTAPGGATATAETTLNVAILADDNGVQVSADVSLAGTAASCNECEAVLSNASARPAVRFLMVVTITDAPLSINWSGNAVSVLPTNPPFTANGDAELTYQVRSDEGNQDSAILQCHSNEFANPVFPCPTAASSIAELEPGTYIIECNATLSAASADSLADSVTPAEASSEVDWTFILGEVTPPEGSQEGEGILEGVSEGALEGVVDGEGATEGTVEGEGQAEGQAEGVAEGAAEGEGDVEGQAEGYAEGEGEGGPDYPQGCALPAGCDGGNPAKVLGDWLLGAGLLAALVLSHFWALRAGK